ncbi:MAG: restriction endonuclease subunit S [Fermentimonas sp.]|nr:restriction endonuclease subunit S [Fermentimonas sp.]
MGDIMKESKKIPEIRFEGFEGEWEDNQFNNVAIYRNGRAHENDIEERGKYIVVNSKFVSTNGEVKKYSNKQNEPLYLGEIAFVLSDVPNGRAIARTFLVDANNKYTLNQRIAAITPTEETDSYFLYILLNRNKYFLQFDDGAKQTNLSKVDVENFLSYYPSKPEQSQIGTFFQNLDQQITLEQQKHDKLVTLKKAMLEKMFPKEGASVPEIRFEGFEGEWVKKRLEDFCSYHSSNLSYNSVIANGQYELYDANGVIGYSNDYFLDSDYITIIKDGSGVGRVRLLPKNTSFIGTMGAFKVKDSDIRFLLCCLLITDFSKHVIGATIPHIYFSNYGKEEYFVPSIEEQSQIGSYFQNLDNLISLQQQKIDKLKNIKKACLDKMFV